MVQFVRKRNESRRFDKGYPSGTVSARSFTAAHRSKANEVSVQNEQPLRRWTPPRAPLVIFSLLVIGLNAFDGYATLRACRTMGVVELNPVMAALLAIGPGAFVAAKTLGVALAILLLAWGLHHPRARDHMRKFGWGGLIVLTAAYSLLCAWHVLIMSGLISPPDLASSASPSPACEMYKNRPR